MDTVNPDTRSRIMSAVRSEGSGPEKEVRHLLRFSGYQFKANVRTLPGTPDIVLPRFRTVMFVNGCFWHGHKRCAKGRTLPKSRRRFWTDKFERNRRRDVAAKRKLWKLGWKVVTIWECELADPILLIIRVTMRLEANREG